MNRMVRFHDNGLSRRESQAGVVLPVALLVLLLVSIIVASTVQTSRFEESMALNVQIGNQTFQAAETALDDLLDDTGDLDDVIQGTTSAALSSVSLDTDWEGDADKDESMGNQLQRLRAESDAVYVGQTICVGFSLDKCQNHKVEVIGRGYVDEDGVYGNDDDEARTVLVQGVDRYNYVTEE